MSNAICRWKGQRTKVEAVDPRAVTGSTLDPSISAGQRQENILSYERARTKASQSDANKQTTKNGKVNSEMTSIDLSVRPPCANSVTQMTDATSCTRNKNKWPSSKQKSINASGVSAAGVEHEGMEAAVSTPIHI